MILLYTCILYVVCTFSLFSFSAKPSRLMTGINLSLWVKSIFFCFQFVIVKKGHLVPFWPRFFHFPFSPLLITSVFHRFSLAFFFPLYWKRKKKKNRAQYSELFYDHFLFPSSMPGTSAYQAPTRHLSFEEPTYLCKYIFI